MISIGAVFRKKTRFDESPEKFRVVVRRDRADMSSYSSYSYQYAEFFIDRNKLSSITPVDAPFISECSGGTLFKWGEEVFPKDIPIPSSEMDGVRLWFSRRQWGVVLHDAQIMKQD